MRNRRRIALIAGIVVIAFIVFTVGATVAINVAPKQVQQLSKVSYNQTKAVLGWDDSTQTTTDDARLTALRNILTKDGWAPGWKGAKSNGCAGGLATNVTMAFHDGSTSKLSVYQCGGKSDALTKDVTDLVSTWRGTSS